MELVTPELGLIFWMLVSFGIVFFILKKFAWKPILGMLKSREEAIDSALRMADKTREDMDRLKADNARMLDEARMEQEKIFKDAQDMHARIVAEAKEQARKEREKILEEARALIETEKRAALREIRANAADMAVEIAEKLLSRELSSENKQKAYLQSLTEQISVN